MGWTRIGIVGSRRWSDRRAVEELIKQFPAGTVVVSGGCRGVDTWAIEIAQDCSLKTCVYPPALPPAGSAKWEFTKAYYERNRKIAEDVDVLFAFVAPDRRGGTENTIQHAMKLGVRVEVICEGSRGVPGNVDFDSEISDKVEDWSNIGDE